MSFLSIAFLAALPLAAAPLLLHLFDRRRNVVIEWGAMQFLMEAASRRTSARKLKQWLLLMMRTLAVAALVLALSRPMLPQRWFGTSDRGETVLVIDNSMSMLRASEDGPLFDRAIARAVELLDELPTGDSVRILLASPYPVWATGGSMRVDTASRGRIADQLRELKPTHGRSDLLAALFTAAQAEIEPMQQHRRIVVLSDGQAADWRLADKAGWKRFREALQTTAVPTQLEILELEQHAAPRANLAVNGIEASRTLVGVNQPFTLTAHVQNHGQSNSPACSATWQIAGQEQYSGHVPALAGGKVHDVSWKHSLSKPGVYAVTCEVDSQDALPPDNRATVVVEVVEEVPVVVLEGAADRAELQQDSFFVQAALGWMHGEPLAQQGVHVPLVVDADRLERLDLEQQRAVVIPNFTSLSREMVAALEEFVSAGGGLWIALGPRTDVEAFNQHFYAEGNGLAPLAIDRIVDEHSSADGAYRSARTHIDSPPSQHPATAALADSQRLDTTDISVARHFRFINPAQSEDVSVLLSLTNGQPLAVEKYVGQGRVIVQSIPLRLDWSDLARSQAFVVMVQDWLAYLTQPRATRHNLSPGDPIAVHLPEGQTREATLHTPHGDLVELTADAAGQGVVFRSSRTILPGDYHLELGFSGEAIPFHVSRDAAESNLAALSAAESTRLAEIVDASREPREQNPTGIGQHEPLWPMLLVILIGLITAELILSGMIARERFGGEPIPEAAEIWAARAAPRSNPAETETMSNREAGIRV